MTIVEKLENFVNSESYFKRLFAACVVYVIMFSGIAVAVKFVVNIIF